MSCAPTELWVTAEPHRGDGTDRQAVSTPAEKTDNTESNPGGEIGIIVAVSENLIIFADDYSLISMTKEEKIAYWLDLADYDIETAEGLLVVKRWLYVGFMCHQVIEKTLKAYWCKTQDDDPPYIHNLAQLSIRSGLYEQMSPEQQWTIAQLMPMNIEARYPEYKEQLLKRMTPEFCRQLIDDTKTLQ